jgi:hypothetical protein
MTQCSENRHKQVLSAGLCFLCSLEINCTNKGVTYLICKQQRSQDFPLNFQRTLYRSSILSVNCPKSLYVGQLNVQMNDVFASRRKTFSASSLNASMVRKNMVVTTVHSTKMRGLLHAASCIRNSRRWLPRLPTRETVLVRSDGSCQIK